MAAQQCRESRYFHGIICCYIGFAFFSPCKFQTGNPSRRCALQGSLWAGLAACCHAFLARSPDKFGSWRCFPKSGTAEDAIQLSREEVYLLVLYKSCSPLHTAYRKPSTQSESTRIGTASPFAHGARKSSSMSTSLTAAVADNALIGQSSMMQGKSSSGGMA